MQPWETRPSEIANLLNPAFCGAVIWASVRAYETETARPMPFPLAFLILPIVLHKKTRQKISRRLPMHARLEKNQFLKIGFGGRAKQLGPIAREAIAFLLQVDAIAISADGGLLTTHNLRLRDISNDEVSDCYRKARILGMWFASAGTISTIFAMWGVRP